MADAIDPKPILASKRIMLPKWYKVLVCLGSVGIGGFFGAIHMIPGAILGATGGLGVAILWLYGVSRITTHPFIKGISWGVLAGILDTLWLHGMAFGLNYTPQTNGESEMPIDAETIIFIGLILGVIAGAIYGLICISVLEIYRKIKRRKTA